MTNDNSRNTDGCVRLDTSLRSRWVFCVPCTPLCWLLLGDQRKIHLPNILDGKHLCRLLFKQLLLHAISERSHEWISRGGFSLSEVTKPDRLQQLRSELRLMFQLKCPAVTCIFALKFKLPFMPFISDKAVHLIVSDSVAINAMQR